MKKPVSSYVKGLQNKIKELESSNKIILDQQHKIIELRAKNEKLNNDNTKLCTELNRLQIENSDLNDRLATTHRIIKDTEHSVDVQAGYKRDVQAENKGLYKVIENITEQLLSKVK